MVILKKVKASTLMETLVATILIVIIFMLASMIMNNLFSNTIKNNTRAINAYISELTYLQLNEKLELPYQTDFNDWSIEVFNNKKDQETHKTIEAFNKKTNQTITKHIFETK